MADEEVVACEPDVGFDACAAGCEGFVEGDSAPVVVVGMARDRGDVLAEVGRRRRYLCLRA